MFQTHVAFRFLFLLEKDRHKQKALIPKNQGFFPSGDPNRMGTVMRAHNAERARDFIMRPNATP
ncbi:hypothetical protein [Rothia mucilaginosa]|uniref:hypothetical protein n=1 Tax=Rothia mucilaginosa TaxID=43675 RepID=UPI003C79DDD7